ncbi:MAG: hypothetical protein ACRERE_37410 [Candidatus Entotheonellia bacterium]
MRHRFFAQFRIFAGVLVLMAPLSCSGAADWEQAQIADALRAAPPTVTHQAKIYAWQAFGQLVLVRDGPGPYTCVASGSASLRFAKPPLPFPDPFCADPHAWAFIQAYWTEEDQDPTEAIRPLPHAPGLVWMLAGRQGVTSHVAAGKDEPALVQTTLTRVAQGVGQAAASSISLTPQLLLLPLPLDPAASAFPDTADPMHPLTLWMRARGTPIGYAPVPVPEAVHQALRVLPPNPTRLP